MLKGMLLTLLTVVAASTQAFATNSRPELSGVLRDLLAWLPGEYSSAPQVALERAHGAPPDGEHDEQYRRFTRIDAPHLGPYVIYGEIHIGGPDGPIVKGQQVLYIISIDEANSAVSISGRRIADPEKFVGAGQRPEIWRQLRPDPDYGGNCDFRWQRHGTQIVGRLAPAGKPGRTCTHQSRTSGKWMRWDAEWVLSESELWVFDNGYMLEPDKLDSPGRLFVGRNDLTHERLYKARRFVCEGPGLARTTLIDTGGRATLAGNEQTLTLLRWSVESTGTLSERLTLAISDAAGRTLGQAVAPASVGAIELRNDRRRFRCSRTREE